MEVSCEKEPFQLPDSLKAQDAEKGQEEHKIEQSSVLRGGALRGTGQEGAG